MRDHLETAAGSFGDSSDSEVEDEDDPVIEGDAVGEDDCDDNVVDERGDINGAGILSCGTPDGDESSAITPVVRKKKVSAVSSKFIYSLRYSILSSKLKYLAMR